MKDMQVWSNGGMIPEGRTKHSEGEKSVPSPQWHSLFCLRTGHWIEPVKADEVAVFHTHRLINSYPNERRQT